jgi:hypothetical protein
VSHWELPVFGLPAAEASACQQEILILSALGKAACVHMTCWLQAHAAAKRAQRQAIVMLRDSEAAEAEVMRQVPELEGGNPDDLKSEVDQKRADLIIYEQEVPQRLQNKLRWLDSAVLCVGCTALTEPCPHVEQHQQ